MLDTSAPNLARAYDYLLGGRANFAADRALAGRLTRLYPSAPELLLQSRTQVAACLDAMAHGGVAQYVDVGSGLPTEPSAHAVVRAVVPGARVAYVDRDRSVASHVGSLVPPGVRAFEGDLAEPEALVEAVGGFIDFARPACLVLAMVLQVLEPPTARAVARVLIRALAPGSYVLVTAGEGERGRLPDAVSPGGFEAADIAGYCAGLEPLRLGEPRGLGEAQGAGGPGGLREPGSLAGRPAPAGLPDGVERIPAGDGAVLCAVGRKPPPPGANARPRPSSPGRTPG